MLAGERRWHRALNRGAVLLVLAALGTCSIGVLRGIHPPFATLHAMAQVGVFMDFHDRGLAGPSFLGQRSPPGDAPCFRDGGPDPVLRPGADCHPGLFQAEDTYTHGYIPWSAANTSGVVMPAFMLHTPFGARLLSCAESPCRAVRDFDGVVLPARPGRRGLDWLIQEMGDIRKAFDCDGDGGLRAGRHGRWAATTFRLHLYDASGRVVSTLDMAPRWATPHQGSTPHRRFSPADWTGRHPGYGWLADQFPPAARLDPPGTRAHSNP